MKIVKPCMLYDACAVQVADLGAVNYNSSRQSLSWLQRLLVCLHESLLYLLFAYILLRSCQNQPQAGLARAFPFMFCLACFFFFSFSTWPAFHSSYMRLLVILQLQLQLVLLLWPLAAQEAVLLFPLGHITEEEKKKEKVASKTALVAPGKLHPSFQSSCPSYPFHILSGEQGRGLVLEVSFMGLAFFFSFLEIFVLLLFSRQNHCYYYYNLSLR